MLFIRDKRLYDLDTVKYIQNQYYYGILQDCIKLHFISDLNFIMLRYFRVYYFFKGMGNIFRHSSAAEHFLINALEDFLTIDWKTQLFESKTHLYRNYAVNAMREYQKTHQLPKQFNHIRLWDVVAHKCWISPGIHKRFCDPQNDDHHIDNYINSRNEIRKLCYIIARGSSALEFCKNLHRFVEYWPEIIGIAFDVFDKLSKTKFDSIQFLHSYENWRHMITRTISNYDFANIIHSYRCTVFTTQSSRYCVNDGLQHILNIMNPEHIQLLINQVFFQHHGELRNRSYSDITLQYELLIFVSSGQTYKFDLSSLMVLPFFEDSQDYFSDVLSNKIILHRFVFKSFMKYQKKISTLLYNVCIPDLVKIICKYIFAKL